MRAMLRNAIYLLLHVCAACGKVYPIDDLSGSVVDMAGGATDMAQKIGSVTISSSTVNPGPPISVSSATASFSNVDPFAAQGCTQNSYAQGACVVTACPVPGTIDAGAVAQPTAGGITVTGGLKTVTLTPDANGIYAASGFVGSDKLFDGGETFTVSAAGAAVPTFASSALKAPHRVAITLPGVPI